MRWLLGMAAAILLSGCGDKVPQSEAAKKVGDQPKQVIDRVAQDAAKVLQQGADRTADADKKN